MTVLHLLGMGPGDPELITLRAARLLAGAKYVAHFAKRGETGHAFGIAAPHLQGAEILRFDYPMTTEFPAGDPRYRAAMVQAYDDAAVAIAERLQHDDVALLCEGDPFFYGSAMYVFDRLRSTQTIDITPGITGMSGAWSHARTPMVHGDDTLTVIPATLDEAALERRLRDADAAVVMKLGRHLPKLRAVLDRIGRLDRAIYVERGTMAAERIMPLQQMQEKAPYFSLVLIPTQFTRMSAGSTTKAAGQTAGALAR